jgi:hypothetical protein
MSRRIVIAEIQSIVYNEWLPILLGPEMMDQVKHFDTLMFRVTKLLLLSFIYSQSIIGLSLDKTIQYY